jgi:ATP-dependent DNA helicase RecG
MTDNWFLHDTENHLKCRNNAVVHRDYALTGKDIKEAIYDYLVPSWTKKGIQLHPLYWPDNQVYDKGDIEMIPSWTQKSTHLLRKKAWYLIGILSLCSAPIKFQRMLEAFNYKNEKTFRDNYIKPLRNVGFITMTIPEKPTDPENKYVITEEGKSFLSGQFVYPNS